MCITMRIILPETIWSNKGKCQSYLLAFFQRNSCFFSICTINICLFLIFQRILHAKPDKKEMLLSESSIMIHAASKFTRQICFSNTDFREECKSIICRILEGALS